MPRWNMAAVRPHERVVISFKDVKSRTRQEFKKECDVNELMRRYKTTGVLPQATSTPRYLDCASVPNFADAMQLMIDAEAAFMRLPAIVRRGFDNDPQAFVAFAQDGENLPKLREWGLAAPEKAPEEPMRVRLDEDQLAGLKLPAELK